MTSSDHAEAADAQATPTKTHAATTRADVVVTGANGLVGSAVCRALVERGGIVRAVVRREGTAPALQGLTEHIGEFFDAPTSRRRWSTVRVRW